jgi:1-acyl-sn-glycerol-3-phosphate acyltransferase
MLRKNSSPNPSLSRSPSPRLPYIPKNASPLQRVQAMRAAGLSLDGEEIPEEEDLTGQVTRSQQPQIVIHDEELLNHLIDPHLPPPLGRAGTMLNLVASHNETAPTLDINGKVIVASSLSPLRPTTPNKSSTKNLTTLNRSSSSGRSTPISPLVKQSSSTSFTPSPSHINTSDSLKKSSSSSLNLVSSTNEALSNSLDSMNQSFISTTSSNNVITMNDSVLIEKTEKEHTQKSELNETTTTISTSPPILPVDLSMQNNSFSLPGASATTPTSISSPNIFSRLWNSTVKSTISTPPKSIDGQGVQSNEGINTKSPPPPHTSSSLFPSFDAQILSLTAMILHRDQGKKREGFHIDHDENEDEVIEENKTQVKIVDASEEALHVSVFGSSNSNSPHEKQTSHHDLEALAVLRSSTVNHHVNETPHWPAYMPKHIVKEDEVTGRIRWEGDLPAWESLHRWIFALCTSVTLFPIRLSLLLITIIIQIFLSFLATIVIDQFLRLMKELDILSGSDGIVRDVRYIVPEWVDATIPPEIEEVKDINQQPSVIREWGKTNKTHPQLQKDNQSNATTGSSTYLIENKKNQSSSSSSSSGLDLIDPADPEPPMSSSSSSSILSQKTPTSSSSSPSPSSNQLNDDTRTIENQNTIDTSTLTPNQKRILEAQEIARVAARKASENAKIAATLAKQKAERLYNEAMRLSSKSERRVMYYKTLNFLTYYARALWLNIPTWAEVRLLLAAPVRFLLRIQLFLLGVHWVNEIGYLHPKIKPLPTPEDDNRDLAVENPRVIVANHQSFLEAMYLMWRVNGGCVIDADLPNSNFLLGIVTRTLGCILVDRSKPETSQFARDEIKRRAISDISLPLVVFPEGEAHYSNGSAVQNFKTPAFAPMLPVQAAAISFPHVYLDVSLTEAFGGNVSLYTLILRMMCSIYVSMEVRWIPPRGPTRTEKKDDTGVMFARGVMRDVASVLGVRSSDSALAEARLWLVAQRLHLLPHIAVSELKKTLNLSKLFLDDAVVLFRELNGRGLLQLGSTLHESDFAILMTEKDKLIGAEHLYEQYLLDSKKVIKAADELADLIKTHSWETHDHNLGTLEPQLGRTFSSSSSSSTSTSSTISTNTNKDEIESSQTPTEQQSSPTFITSISIQLRTFIHFITHTSTLFFRRQYLHLLVFLGRITRLFGRPSNVLYPSIASAVERAEEYIRAVEKLKWIKRTRILPKQYLSRLFYALDKDGLGAVDARELIISLSLLNERERVENNVEKLDQSDALTLRDYTRDDFEFNSNSDEARQRLLIRHRDVFMAAFAQLDEHLKYDDDEAFLNDNRKKYALEAANVVRIADETGLGQVVLSHIFMRALVDPVRLARVIVTVWPKVSYERLSDLFIIGSESNGNFISAPDFLHWVCLPTVSCLIPLFRESGLYVGFNKDDMLIRAADHDLETAEYWKEHGSDQGKYENLIKKLNEREKIKASLRYERRIVTLGKYFNMPERPKVYKIQHYETTAEIEDRLTIEAYTISSKSIKATPGALGRSNW